MRKRIVWTVAFLGVAGARVTQPQAAAEKTAAEVYKNVQVLKDVPASQFMNTMFFQRYALGVSCNYCHVGTSWESDDKKEKRKAREMIRMVLDLNRTVFGGKTAVNCMTCHRGSTAPVTEVASIRRSMDELIGPRRGAPGNAIAPAPTATVDGVIAAYLRALGERDSVARISARTTRGNLITSEGLIVPYEETVGISPRRWVTTSHFGGMLGDFSTGFDGDTVWNNDNRGLTIRSGPARGRDVMNVDMQNPFLLKDLYDGLTVAGTEIVAGTPTTVLAGTSKASGQRERLYFDAAGGLLLRRTTLTDGAYGGYASDLYFENYRRIDGVMVPTLISSMTPDFASVRKVSFVEHNPTINPEVFRVPKRAAPAPRPLGFRPPVRSGFGLAYDTQRSRLVLFGGSDSAFQRLGDTWEWDGTRWTSVQVTGPSPRSDFAMAYDSRRNRVVLFGGRTAAGLSGETWEFDGSRWSAVDSTGPAPRALTAMAYDETRGRLVLFGGSAGNARFNDTWQWDGRRWAQAPTAASPPPRASHAMAYDADRKKTLLIAGYGEDELSDSWEWDGRSWTQIAGGPAVLHTAAAYDPTRRRIVMFGGFSGDARTARVVERAGSDWRDVDARGPGARAEHRGAYVPGAGFVIFGGIGGQGMSVEERGRAKLNDLWAFDGTRWKELTTGAR